MAVTEVSGLMKYKDASGNTYIMLPVTTKDNVDGLDGVHVRIIGTTTAGDGSAYTATVEGITALTAGTMFVMIPHVVSTTTAPTLNVNGLGAKNIRRRISGNSATTSAGTSSNWIAAGKPLTMTYDGTYWIADFDRPNAADLYGTLAGTKVSYDNSSSGLTSSTVQAAIDEIAGEFVSAQTLTTAEYEALETKSASTLYLLTDDTSEDEVAEHIANEDIHVTAEDKATWNAKAGTENIYTKTESLSDATKTLFGLTSDAVPDDVLNGLAESVLLANVAIALPSSETWGSVTYGNGKFVALAVASTKTAYSTDGVTWTAAAMPSSESWYSVTYGNGKFVAVAVNSSTAAYSTDGVTWTAAAMPSSESWYSVTYGNGKFVAVANSSTKAAYSTDGVTWTAATLPSSESWYSVTYGNGKFVALAVASTKTAYSTDGVTWTAAAMPSGANWYSVTYGNGKFVAVAFNSSTAAYSADGVTWTAATLPSSAYWYSVTYGNGKFVAVANGSTAAYSTDGVTWSNTAPALQNISGTDIANNIASVLGGTKIATGSYIGTGTCGSDNPNSLIFEFEPKLVIIGGHGKTSVTNPNVLVLINGTTVTMGLNLASGNPASYSAQALYVEWDGKKVSWYNTNSSYGPYYQFNAPNTSSYSYMSYNYIAIG